MAVVYYQAFEKFIGCIAGLGWLSEQGFVD